MERLTALVLLAASATSGCTPSPSASPPSVAPAPARASGTPAPPTAATPGSTASEVLADGRSVTVRTDSQGRKWLGDVPYDVFFDDPLGVAAEGRSVPPAKQSPAGAPAKGSTAVASTGRTANPTASGDADAWNTSAPKRSKVSSSAAPRGSTPKSAAPTEDWSRLIDAETLDSEVKRIRTDLTAGLQSVAKYNTHYQEVAVSAATLAALAEIVAEDSRSVSWKDNAATVRDLSSNVHDAAKGLGSSAYQATKAPGDQLMDVLDGNVPAGLPPSAPRRDFSEFANRSSLMKRMERAFQRLKKEGSAQKSLKDDAAQVLEDSSMLAVLGRVIAVGRYDSTDDPKYQSHAADLSRAASDLTTAIKSSDGAGFGDALSRVQKRCDECHAAFRF